MKPVHFLRIAAVLTLIHSALHTVGGVFGAPPAAAADVVQAMKTIHFPVMGVTRSYWDFYLGLGLAVSVFLTIESVVFWQLGTISRTNAAQIRSILITFLVAYLSLAVISWKLLFAGPMVAQILISLCLALAIWTTPSGLQTTTS